MDGLNVEWECPSCTLINKGASYKCQCCGTSKGTSTRQTKLYHAALEQQYVAESFLTSQRQQSSKGSLKTTPLQNVQAQSLSPESSATTNHAVSDVSASSSSTSSNTSASNGGLSGRGRRRKRSPSSNIASSSSSDTQSKLRSSSRLYKKHSEWPKLTDIDRSNAKCCKITVDSVTVKITEYRHSHSSSQS